MARNFSGSGSALLLLAVALLVPTYPLWLGQALPRWDALSFYYPAWSLVADAAREGQLILWNLWVSGGRPEAADPQVGALSPLMLTAAFVLGGSMAGFKAYWLGIWLATAAGVVVLTRYLGAPLWGATIAGAGILGSGFAITHAQHTAFLATFAFLPWILWRLDIALFENRRRPAAEAGVLVGLSGLGGYPALVLMSGMVAALWIAGRLFSHGSASLPATPGPRVSTFLRTMLLVGLLSVAVLAPTYVAFIVEGRGYSSRVDALPRERAIQQEAAHPASLATFLAPRLALAPIGRQPVWSLSGFTMSSCYLGAATLLLAILALVHRPRDRWRWWLAGMALLFLGFSLGPILPLRGWLYDFFPPTRFFRHSGVFRIGALIAIAVLAALATRDRDSDRSAWNRRLMMVSLSGAVFGTVAIWLIRRGEPIFLQALPQLDLMGVGVLFLMPALIVGLGFLHEKKRGPTQLVPRLLVALALVDAAGAIWVCRKFVYSQMPNKVFGEVTAEHRQLAGDLLDQTPRGLARRPTGSHNNLDLVAREAVLLAWDPFSSQLSGVWATEPDLVAVASGADRIWFSPVAAVAPATLETLKKFEARFRQLGGPIMLVHPQGGLEPSRIAPFDDLPPMVKPPVEVLEYRPEQLRLRVDAPSDGWLWVTDRWAQGWSVAVDGQPQPVWQAGLLFRGVEVRAGKQELFFSYRPFGHPWLFLLSLAAVASVACCSIRVLIRRILQSNAGAK